MELSTYLMFAERGEEAVNFYVSLFPDSRVHSVTRAGPGGPVAEGALLHASFTLAGQPFQATDGGSYFSFSQGVSVYVDCDAQEEIDRLWAALTDGGTEEQCGWVKDRYGLSWQIAPRVLNELMEDPDPGVRQRVMDAMLQMVKFDIEGLRRAAEQR